MRGHALSDRDRPPDGGIDGARCRPNISPVRRERRPFGGADGFDLDHPLPNVRQKLFIFLQHPAGFSEIFQQDSVKYFTDPAWLATYYALGSWFKSTNCLESVNTLVEKVLCQG